MSAFGGGPDKPCSVRHLPVLTRSRYAKSKLKAEFMRAKFDYVCPGQPKRLCVQQKEELVMTQFMKLFLAGTITGMLMTTAAIGTAAVGGPENRITILCDAFGKDASMRKDWGFSALVEIAAILAANVKAKNVDLTNLDFVVLSHRHRDHMAGLTHVLSVDPKVKIYAPKRASASSARRCRRASIARPKPCRRTCATSTANHRR